MKKKVDTFNEYCFTVWEIRPLSFDPSKNLQSHFFLAVTQVKKSERC